MKIQKWFIEHPNIVNVLSVLNVRIAILKVLKTGERVAVKARGVGASFDFSLRLLETRHLRQLWSSAHGIEVNQLSLLRVFQRQGPGLESLKV